METRGWRREDGDERMEIRDEKVGRKYERIEGRMRSVICIACLHFKLM